MIEYAQRLAHRGRNLLGVQARPSVGASLFDAALRGGGQALGADAALRVGATADIVALDPAHPALIGRTGDMLLDSWIFTARHGAIDGVWRGGRKCVSGGRHHRADAIGARYAEVIHKLLA